MNKSHSIYIRPVRILNSDEFPERRSSKLIMSIEMNYVIKLLFTLQQVVANNKIISHIVIMISIRADLMGEMYNKQGISSDTIPSHRTILLTGLIAGWIHIC